MLLEFVVFGVIGALAGFAAGLLGIGGGLIIVPALIFFLEPAQGAHVAVATSLSTIVPTSISSVYAHHRHDAVNWPLAALLSPGLVLGAAVGSQLASQLSGLALTAVFGGFCLLAGARMFRPAQEALSNNLPGRFVLTAAGLGIGAVSAVVGIGGGTLTVPFLSGRGIPIHKAVATSAACGLPIAMAGMLGFMLAGQGMSELPAGSLGFVWLPAVLGISVASVLFAPLGARAAHRSSQVALKRIFGSFLLLLGCYFIIGFWF
jgi:uncharacterized membrane protein YfcA